MVHSGDGGCDGGCGVVVGVVNASCGVVVDGFVPIVHDDDNDDVDDESESETCTADTKGLALTQRPVYIVSHKIICKRHLYLS